MRTLFFFLCLLSVSALGQGVAVRSSGGLATNLTVNGFNPTNAGRVYLRTNGLDSNARVGDPTRAYHTASNAISVAMQTGYTLDIGNNLFHLNATTNGLTAGAYIFGKNNITFEGQGPNSGFFFTNYGDCLLLSNVNNFVCRNMAWVGPGNYQSLGATATRNAAVISVRGNASQTNHIFDNCHIVDIPNFFYNDSTDMKTVDYVTIRDSYVFNCGFTNANFTGQPDGGVIFAGRNVVWDNVSTDGIMIRAHESEPPGLSTDTDTRPTLFMKDCKLRGLYYSGVSLFQGGPTATNYFWRDTIIDNCEFEGGALVVPGDRSLITLQTGVRLKVTNCKFRNWDRVGGPVGYGILFVPQNTGATTEGLIDGCTFEGITIPVFVQASTAGKASNIVIRSSYMFDSGLDCIQLNGAQNVQVLDNIWINWGTNGANRAGVMLHNGGGIMNSNVTIRGNTGFDTKGTPTSGPLIRSFEAGHLDITEMGNYHRNLSTGPYDVSNIGSEFRSLWHQSLTNGFLGIRTNAPAAALHVAAGGNAIIETNLTVQGGSGSSFILLRGTNGLDGQIQASDTAKGILLNTNEAGVTNGVIFGQLAHFPTNIGGFTKDVTLLVINTYYTNIARRLDLDGAFGLNGDAVTEAAKAAIYVDWNADGTWDELRTNTAPPGINALFEMSFHARIPPSARFLMTNVGASAIAPTVRQTTRTWE